MKRNKPISIILVFGIIFLLIGTGFLQSAKGVKITKRSTQEYHQFEGNILYVGGDDPENYNSIQEAVDTAKSGDIVYVFNGTYYENVFINKTINLIGENKETTIIDGRENKKVIFITANLVNISGFTIQNSNKIGIQISSNYNTIYDNLIINNKAIGVYSSFSYNNNISNNFIANNSDNNVWLIDSSNNIISDNNIIDSQIGVWIWCYSSNNTIFGNSINNNTKEGIKIHYLSNNNLISYNSISNNNEGIDIADSFDNNIYYNNFIKNSKNVIFRDCKNNWKGNYWNHPKILPKLVFGRKLFIGFDKGLFPTFEFDFRPSLKLNEKPSAYPRYISTNRVSLSNDITNSNTEEKTVIQQNTKSTSISDTKLIDEFTWAVMHYGHPMKSLNFGMIDVPKPSQGVTIVPTNFMSPELCKVALKVYHEDKIETLNALLKYDKENKKHIIPALNPVKSEWNTPGATLISGAWRSDTAHEMFLLGERDLFSNIVGDCYAHACFNTAVLRLCNFSAEEVFTIYIKLHLFNVVKVNDKWYYFDGSRGLLQDHMNNSMIYMIENDRYFINFRDPKKILTRYSNNMNSTLIHNISDSLLPTIGNPLLGPDCWDLDEFINFATPNPNMINVSIPYTVKDATGETIDQKANSLASLNREFITTHANLGDNIPNQYTRACYCYNLLNVEYPQAYANAAKLASLTSYFGDKLDSLTPIGDITRTAMWIRNLIKTEQVLGEDRIAFSDLPYVIKKGSTLDKSVMAYGTIRNMKKGGDFWQPNDLFIVVTDDNEGYLAVKKSDNWQYINFLSGRPVLSKLNKEISFVFNEQNRYDSLPVN